MFAVLDKISYQFSGLALFLLCVVMILEVLLRYVPWFNFAQDWVPGVLILMDTWLIFLASVAAMYRDKHLRINFFVKKMPQRMGEWNTLLVNTITLCLLLLMTYSSVPIVRSGMDLTFAGVPFSKGYSFMALPVCTSLMALMVVRRIAVSIQKLRLRNAP